MSNSFKYNKSLSITVKIFLTRNKKFFNVIKKSLKFKYKISKNKIPLNHFSPISMEFNSVLSTLNLKHHMTNEMTFPESINNSQPKFAINQISI